MIPTDALFRYQIVSMVLTRMRSGESRAEAVRTVAAMTHHLSAGCFRRVSTRSIYRWLAAYEEAGILGLVTAAAQLPEPSSGVISPKLIAFFRKQKAADPKVSIPEMIRRAEKAGHLKITRPLHRVTVYRALKKVGISVRRRKSGKDRDARLTFRGSRVDFLVILSRVGRVAYSDSAGLSSDANWALARKKPAVGERSAARVRWRDRELVRGSGRDFAATKPHREWHEFAV